MVVLRKNNSGYEEPLREQITSILRDLKFDGFDPHTGDYVIHLGLGTTTPALWCNVIANEIFGTVVSESGLGFSWLINSGEFRLSPLSQRSSIGCAWRSSVSCASYDTKLHTIFANNAWNTEFSECMAFVSATSPPHSVSGDRSEFFGPLRDVKQSQGLEHWDFGGHF